jgi:opacity protein-like surface antigen
MKNRIFLAILIIVLLLSVSSSFGQVKVGDKYVGAALGLWNGIGFSVNGEFILKDLPNLGTIGAGVELGYASDKIVYYSNTYIPLFAFGSFHYRLESMPKLDLYARLGLGFVIVSSSYKGPVGFDFGGSSSYLGFAGQVGARYAVTEKIWVRAGGGIPYLLFFGVDLSL